MVTNIVSVGKCTVGGIEYEMYIEMGSASINISIDGITVLNIGRIPGHPVHGVKGARMYPLTEEEFKAMKDKGFAVEQAEDYGWQLESTGWCDYA